MIKPPSEPTLVQQSAKHDAQIHPAITPSQPNKVHTGNDAKTATSAGKSSANLPPYMGRMNLPPSEETVASTGTVAANGAQQIPAQQTTAPPSWSNKPASTNPNPAPGLRITSQPMNAVAAQAQALFADQTDGQLTQGSAAAIHALPNSPVGAVPGIRSEPKHRQPAQSHAVHAQRAGSGHRCVLLPEAAAGRTRARAAAATAAAAAASRDGAANRAGDARVPEDGAMHAEEARSAQETQSAAVFRRSRRSAHAGPGAAVPRRHRPRKCLPTCLRRLPRRPQTQA